VRRSGEAALRRRTHNIYTGRTFLIGQSRSIPDRVLSASPPRLVVALLIRAGVRSDQVLTNGGWGSESYSTLYLAGLSNFPPEETWRAHSCVPCRHSWRHRPAQYGEHGGPLACFGRQVVGNAG
jgi:hypothetical protein